MGVEEMPENVHITEKKQICYKGHVQQMADQRLSEIIMWWLSQKNYTRTSKEKWHSGVKVKISNGQLTVGQWVDINERYLGTRK
jgi:hypothetical protein